MRSATEQSAKASAEVRRQFSATVDVAHHLLKASGQGRVLWLLGEGGTAGRTGDLPASLSRNAFSSASRFIGLPDLPPFFLFLPFFLPPAHSRAAEAGDAAAHAATIGHALHHLAACSKRCSKAFT